MASPSVTYTFVNTQTSDGPAVSQNFSDLISALTDGTKDLTIAAVSCTNFTATGNLQFGNATSDTIDFQGRVASSVLPTTTATYDLGSTALRWNNVWAATITGASLTLSGNLTVNGSTDIGSDNTDTVSVNATISTSLIPTTTGTYDLGSSSLVWDQLYVDNVIISSDTTIGDGSGDTLTVNATATFANGVSFNGNTTIGNATSDTLTVTSTITSHLLATDNTYDIGASGATRFRNLYLAGNAIIGGTLSVTGTTTLATSLSGVVKASSGVISAATLVNADVDSAAAIAGTKISPDFGSQNIVTTGTITGTGAFSIGVASGTNNHIVYGQLKARRDQSTTSLGSTFATLQVDNQDSTNNNWATLGFTPNGGSNYRALWAAQFVNRSTGETRMVAQTTDSGGSSGDRITISGAGAVAFPSISTTASAANAFLDSGASNNLLRSTSSLRYKENVEDLKTVDTDIIYKLRPVEFDDKTFKTHHIGLIAEEVADLTPLLVHFTKQSVLDPNSADPDKLVPDGVQYDRLGVLLVKELQLLNGRLKKLEEKEKSH
jgi:hypothetical protein